ncbi:MAG: isoprenylcysteine carboxylmethyltransferase family protein [Nitrospirae bacterium]|nr:isoprenylcysteine carboxylmethyltransferase family protein [Nitrospirota bacterium]
MDKNNFLELRFPPPVVFLAFAGLMWLTSVYIPWATVSLPAKMPFALAIAAVGCLLAGISIGSFLLARTTLHPDKPIKTTTLVVTGVYSITRNPMYLSLLFVLIGWAIYLANVAAALLLPLFVSYLNRFQIKPEERALVSLFGSEFEAYSKRVRRWL